MSDKAEPVIYPDADLPDCRLAANLGGRPTYSGRWGLDAKVFCANCGADGGVVTDAWAATMFFLCERCKHHGIGLAEKPPPMPERVPMYCIHCQVNVLMVSYEESLGKIYVCDACDAKLGALPGHVRAPEPVRSQL